MKTASFEGTNIDSFNSNDLLNDNTNTSKEHSQSLILRIKLESAIQNVEISDCERMVTEVRTSFLDDTLIIENRSYSLSLPKRALNFTKDFNEYSRSQDDEENLEINENDIKEDDEIDGCLCGLNDGILKSKCCII